MRFRRCELCGKGSHEYVQMLRGPVRYTFCDREHMQQYWRIRSESVKLYEWIRTSPMHRDEALLSERGASTQQSAGMRCCMHTYYALKSKRSFKSP